jgi:hypothetical protein
MIDTVILQIADGHFWIANHQKFGNLTKNILNNPLPFVKCPNNPNNKKSDIYYPRLTAIKQGSKLFLKIEFSVPKLLFGNNIDEVNQANFKEIITILKERIKRMGVQVYTNSLENAEVISFHPSKNIILSKGYTSTFALKELSKIDFSQKLDLDIKDYRNTGQAIQLYSNSHALVIYDKINDLNKPKNRAIDKDQTRVQLTLFDSLKDNKLELLRFEVRLAKKRKMNSVLEKLLKKVIVIHKKIYIKRWHVHYWINNRSGWFNRN